MTADRLIATILRHDAKQTSYKIALVRALGELALTFPDVEPDEGESVAVPLRLLAERWIAYYWPFVSETHPVWQGPRAMRDGIPRSDISFRQVLTTLRQQAGSLWAGGPGRASDGFYLTGEMRLPRKRATFRPELVNAYEAVVVAITKALHQPIRYAGPKGQEYAIFPRPARLKSLTSQTPHRAVPGSMPTDVCLSVPGHIWHAFRNLSLWIEALCVHEWCLFTERVNKEAGDQVATDRGDVYRLLTDYPASRLPLKWEHAQIDLLLLDGKEFACPWTGKRIHQPGNYAVDHLVPIAVYPVSELWNLVPADPAFNSHEKRDRLPSPQRLTDALPRLANAYAVYDDSAGLRRAIREDVTLRFQAGTALSKRGIDFGLDVAMSVGHFLTSVADHRNVARF